MSAFTGANVREGALGRFLDAVRVGSVKRGSYLIVESLDRLSREQVLTAQLLFLSIIQAGINLVTLMDGKVYRAGKVDLADLITSLVIMSRAHEEFSYKEPTYRRGLEKQTHRGQPKADDQMVSGMAHTSSGPEWLPPDPGTCRDCPADIQGYGRWDRDVFHRKSAQ